MLYESPYSSEVILYYFHVKHTRTFKWYFYFNNLFYLPGYINAHPPPPALSGPKFSDSENCCGYENAMPPKFVEDMEGY